MSITLTDEQQFIYDDIINKVNNFPGRIEAVIIGYAGVGKTLLTSRIINTLIDEYKVAVTSPTHKANSVIRKMLYEIGINEEDALVSTIHSFLGLKLVNDKSSQVLKHDPHSKHSNTYVDVLIVDECSMISDEMYEHIMKQIHRVRRAVIFIGDPCQLPPVDNNVGVGVLKLSPTFNAPIKYELFKVLRQALNNPILKLATDIRECIGTNNNPMSIISSLTDENTITNVNDEFLFLEYYKEYIMENKGSSRKIYDFAQDNKIIAYTNYRVNYANIYIRNELFSENIENEFIEGEPIIFESTTENCPYNVQQMIQCPAIRKENFLGIDCWQFSLPNGSFILGVGPFTRIKMDEYLEDMISKIERKDENPLTKKPYMWQDYYVIKDKINVINYPYATTTHKSQGSTFNNIWFDTDFIEKIPNNEMKSRILYTALTRPRFSMVLRQNGAY